MIANIALATAIFLGLVSIGAGIKDGMFRIAEVLNLWRLK
jgi:hypothetical protein